MPKGKGKGRGRPVVKVDLTKRELKKLKKQLEEDPLPPEAIRMVRNARGETQTEFGDAIEVSHRTVQDWEGGRRNCTRSARKLVRNMAKNL